MRRARSVRSVRAVATAFFTSAAVVVLAQPAEAATADLEGYWLAAPTTQNVGSTGQYVGSVVNHGPGSGGYSVRFTASGQVGDFTPVSAGCINTNATTIECSGAPILTPGPPRSVIVEAEAAAVGLMTVSMTVVPDAATSDPAPGNNAASMITNNVLPSADVAVSITATAGALLSGRIDYVVGAANAGPDMATGVMIVTTLPSQVTGMSGPLPTGCTYNGASRQMTCALGSLTSGAQTSRAFSASVGLLAIGSLPATVSRTASSPPDPNPANDSASTTCAVVTGLILACP